MQKTEKSNATTALVDVLSSVLFVSYSNGVPKEPTILHPTLATPASQTRPCTTRDSHSSKPPNTPAAAPTNPPPKTMALTAAPAVEACAGAEPVLEALAEAAAVPDPGAGVTLAVGTLLCPLISAVLEASGGGSLAPDEPVCCCCCSSCSSPAVTVTVSLPIYVPSYVSVLDPGKFASLPPAISMHTALLDATTQSWVAVKSVLGSDMSMWYVEGPTTSVCAGNRPQSASTQARASVVASLLALTTDAATMSASPPMSWTVMVWSAWAAARLSMAERTNVEIMLMFRHYGWGLVVWFEWLVRRDVGLGF